MKPLDAAVPFVYPDVTATGGFAKSDGLDRAPPARQTRDQVGPEEVRRPEPSADTYFVAVALASSRPPQRRKRSCDTPTETASGIE